MDEYYNKIVETIKILSELENNKIIMCDNIFIGFKEISFLFNFNSSKFRIIINFNEIDNKCKILFYRSISKIRIDESNELQSIEEYLYNNYTFLSMSNKHSSKFKTFSFLFIYLLNEIFKINNINKTNKCNIMCITDQIRFYFIDFMVILSTDEIKTIYKNCVESMKFEYASFDNKAYEYINNKLQEMIKDV